MSPRRRRRTKWEHPVSPLQAARFEKRWFQLDACRRLREICPGHGDGRPCRIEPSKLSDYERGVRSPSMKHVLALSALYGKTPDELGLLRRSDMPEPTSDQDETTEANGAENSSKTNRPSSVYATPYGASKSPGDGEPSSPLDGDVLKMLLLSVLLGDGGSDSVRRDTFMRGIGAAAGAVFVDPISELSRRAQAEINHTRVSNQQVERLASTVHHHAWSFYQLNDNERLVSLLHDWVSVQRLLQLPTTHKQHTELLNIYARLSGILGHLAAERLETGRARTLLETALDAAHASGDADLVGWVYNRLAIQANRDRAYGRVIELTNQGLTAIGSGKTPTAAGLHGRVARVYAAMGDERATRTHLEAAERILGDVTEGCWPASAHMPRAFTYREDGLQRTLARAHVWLGNYSEALEHCDRADAIFRELGWSMRTATPVMENRMTRADALLRSGELDAATEIAIVALRAYNGVALPIQLRRGRRFHQRLVLADTGGTYARELGEFLRSRAA